MAQPHPVLSPSSVLAPHQPPVHQNADQRLPVAMCILPFAVGDGGGLGLCLLLHHHPSGDENPSQPHVPRVSL